MTREDVLVAMAHEARRIEEDCLYSGKGHFEASQLWGYVNYTLGILAVVFAALASYSGYSNNAAKAAIFAAVAASLAAVLTFLNSSEKATQHHMCGAKHFSVKDAARRFHEIDAISDTDIKELRERLEQLSMEKGSLNAASPGIPRIAYWLAKRGIKHGEGSYDTDKKRWK